MVVWERIEAELERRHLPGARAVQLARAYVVDEDVSTWTLEHHRWLCDEGHVHVSATVALLTPTRLLLCLVGLGERHGVHPDDPTRTTHEPSEDITLRTVPLRAVEQVTTEVVHRPGGDEAVDVHIVVALGGVRGGAAEPASCGDPECDADHGFDLLLEREVVELGGVDDEVEADLDALVAFGAALSLAVAAG